MKNILLSLLLLTFLFLFSVQSVFAEQDCEKIGISVSLPGSTINGYRNAIITGEQGTVSFDITGLEPTRTYSLRINGQAITVGNAQGVIEDIAFTPAANGTAHISSTHSNSANRPNFEADTQGGRWVYLLDSNKTPVCSAGLYRVLKTNQRPNSCSLQIQSTNPKAPQCFDTSNGLTVSSTNVIFEGKPADGTAYLEVNGHRYTIALSATGSFSQAIPASDLIAGSIPIVLKTPGGPGGVGAEELCKISLPVQEKKCIDNQVTVPNTGATTGSGTPLKVGAQDCDYALPGGKLANGVITALGCIPTDLIPFIEWLFRYAVSIGGGVAFLLMAWGAFLFITSAGDPDKVKQGQETLVSAGAGLIFILFAVFILRFIGVDLLQIPGFS